MPRHLRQHARLTGDCPAATAPGQLFGERGIGREFDDAGAIEQIAGADLPGRAQPVVAIQLQAVDARAAEVLALLQVRADRDVRHRVLDAVVVLRRAHRRRSGGRHAHADLAAVQALGTELIVGAGRDRARPRTADTARSTSARGTRRRNRAQALTRVLMRYSPAILGLTTVSMRSGQRRLVVRGRQAGRHGRLEKMPVVVVPAIDPCAQRDVEFRRDRDEVLHERPEAALRAAGHAFGDRRLPARRVEDRVFAVAIDPAPVRARA